MEAIEAFSHAPDGPDGPAEIAAALVKTDDAFLDLREGDAAILFLMREESKYNQDQLELGSMSIPAGFQGKLGVVARWLLAKVCGGLPDFIMILDAQWWTQATLEQRTALVFHEMLHAGVETDKDGMKKFTEEGRPRWCVRPHDLEAFDAEVERYGAWRPNIRSFVNAYHRHTP